MMKLLRRLDLTQWIIVAMVAGIALGYFWPEGALSLRFLSNMFLRMIKLIIVPIIFSTLVVGVAGHGGSLKAVGKLAIKTIIYFEVITTVALVVGLLAVNGVKPGVGVRVQNAAVSVEDMPQHGTTALEMIEHVVPKSFIEAAASNDVIQVVFFSLLFAIALMQVKSESRKVLLHFCEALTETMFKFTNIVMMFAPIGVGAAIASTVGHSGLGVLVNLGKLVLTLYGSLLVFILLVLVPVMKWARIPVWGFFQAVKEPALTAFATTSSEAALPGALRQMERFGVPKHILYFVMPLGYSFNLDGTTLYLSIAAVFVAQVSGIELPWTQQLLILLTLMLTSKGVAAVPRASLVILSGTLSSFGLPLDGIALILGVDALMDMARTTVNLIGNCLAAAVMARWEKDWTGATE